MSLAIRLKQACFLACVIIWFACVPTKVLALTRLPAVNPAAVNPIDTQLLITPTDSTSLLDSHLADSPSQIKLASYRKQEGWSIGEFQFLVYGTFATNLSYSTSRTNTGPFTLFVFSEETHGEEDFSIDSRRSRFGMDVSGPKIPSLQNAQSHGRLEFDLHGSFVTENRATVLLRHAYWEVRNDNFRLLVGQTWDIISPLNPGTLNYSVGWIAGNIGYRRAQFRAERYLSLHDQATLTLQASLNQDIVTDFTADPGVRRESAGWPVIEGRVAVTMGDKNETGQAPELGFSGHIGETGFDFLTTGPPPLNLPPVDDARFKTWSFNTDLRLPLNERWGVNAEFFTGANLSTMLGGIGQGVCPCVRRSIRSTGGWVDLWHDWTPRLHSHTGFGIDDPNDDDSLFGRTYNQFIFANFTYDITDHWVTGFEVTDWKTLYQEKRTGLIPPNELLPSTPGRAVVLEWLVKYDF